MDKQTFSKKLNDAAFAAINLAKEQVYNYLPQNFVFVIQPIKQENRDNLNLVEEINFNLCSKELKKSFLCNQVVDKLWIDGQIPAHINCTVLKANKRLTTILLITSCRLKSVAEISNNQDEIYPFHIFLQTPPYLAFGIREKFNINWRFNKLQTYFKMRQSKMSLAQEINHIRNRRLAYWLVFDRVIESLNSRSRVDIVHQLLQSKIHVNGRPEGWSNYYFELNKVFDSNRKYLIDSELSDFDYLIVEMRKSFRQ